MADRLCLWNLGSLSPNPPLLISFPTTDHYLSHSLTLSRTASLVPSPPYSFINTCRFCLVPLADTKKRHVLWYHCNHRWQHYKYSWKKAKSTWRACNMIHNALNKSFNGCNSAFTNSVIFYNKLGQRGTHRLEIRGEGVWWKKCGLSWWADSKGSGLKWSCCERLFRISIRITTSSRYSFGFITHKNNSVWINGYIAHTCYIKTLYLPIACMHEKSDDVNSNETQNV